MSQPIELVEFEDGSSAPPPIAQRQLTVVEYAMQRGATPDEVRTLVELQIQMDQHKYMLRKIDDEREREERTRQAVLAYRRDFAAFKGENIIVPKSKHVERGKAGSFMQAEYHIAASMLSPALSKHNFGFRHDQKFGTKEWSADGSNEAIPAGTMVHVPWVYVTCFLEHGEGHMERVDLDGPPDDGTANNAIQNMQSAASMLKRVALLAVTGTATGGEDDENRMRGHKPEDEAPSGADAETLQAGRDASMQGMQALTAWWGSLTAKQRSAFNDDFKGLRRAAQEADNRSAP